MLTIFWDTALVNSGDRHQSLDTVDVISLPHADSTGKWTIKYAGKIAEAQKQSTQYKIIKAQIEKKPFQLQTVINTLCRFFTS